MKILLVHSRLSLSAGLLSGLKGFSTGVCLLPAAPGTEHYASSLEMCSCASRITEEQWRGQPSHHSAVRIHGGSHHLLWGQDRKWNPNVGRESHDLQHHRGLFQCSSILGSQQVLPAFWHTVRHSWCRLLWMLLSLQPSCQTFCQEGCFPVECRTQYHGIRGSMSRGAEPTQKHWLWFWKLSESKQQVIILCWPKNRDFTKLIIFKPVASKSYIFMSTVEPTWVLYFLNYVRITTSYVINVNLNWT